MENMELKNGLKKFKQLLNKHDDTAENAYYFSEFIRYFLKIKPIGSIDLPTAEIMTIIQHEKPIIFYELKKLAPFNHVLEIVTQITIDKETAINHLKILDEQLK